MLRFRVGRTHVFFAMRVPMIELPICALFRSARRAGAKDVAQNLGAARHSVRIEACAIARSACDDVRG